jgi:hypothetical protein
MRPDKTLTASQIIEVRRLLDNLADVAGDASHVLSTGVRLPTGLPLQRMADLDQRMSQLWRAIREILD